MTENSEKRGGGEKWGEEEEKKRNYVKKVRERKDTGHTSLVKWLMLTLYMARCVLLVALHCWLGLMMLIKQKSRVTHNNYRRFRCQFITSTPTEKKNVFNTQKKVKVLVKRTKNMHTYTHTCTLNMHVQTHDERQLLKQQHQRVRFHSFLFLFLVRW